MPTVRTLVRGLCVLAILLGSQAVMRSRASDRAPAVEDRGALAFDPAVDTASQALVTQAMASARPEARALLERIDGLTTVAVGDPGDALGVAGPNPLGGYLVVLNLGETLRTVGQRGATRLVLHELGHVVDFELVDSDVNAQLDAGIPEGLPCPPGTSVGSCAPQAERFAETFAKWAMGNDLGVNLYIGYGVPPPASFDAWAEPLVALGA